jgi:hypothetical protein
VAENDRAELAMEPIIVANDLLSADDRLREQDVILAWHVGFSSF